MGKTRRAVLRHKEEKDGETKRLKNVIRRLESDKRKLLSELKTLEEAFSKSITHIKGKLDKTSIEEVLESINKGKKLPEIEKNSDNKKDCCPKCKEGVIQLITISIRNGEQSFKICSNNRCKYRPPLKEGNS